MTHFSLSYIGCIVLLKYIVVASISILTHHMLHGFGLSICIEAFSSALEPFINSSSIAGQQFAATCTQYPTLSSMFAEEGSCRSVNPITPIPVQTCLPEGIECCLGNLEIGGSGECEYACPLSQYSPAKVTQRRRPHF